MNKEYKSVDDFLLDEEFKKWVINPQPETQQYWSAWLKTHPDKKDMLFLAREIIQSIEFEQNIPAKEAGDRVLGRILKGRRSQYLQPIPDDNPSGSRKTWLKIAASLFILLGLYYGFHWFQPQPQEFSLITAKTVIKENPKGRKSRVQLPDSSFIWLNSESKIAFVEGLEGITRDIKLTGEAFFEVAKDKDRPFVVHTGEVAITALGTAFNVRAYNEDKHIEVALSEGRVKVEKTQPDPNLSTQGYYLNPLQSIRFSKIDNSIDQGVFDPREVLAWKEGIIFFDDASFEEVIHKLGRWYGVEFIVVNRQNIGDWNYGSKFHNESLENVLRSIGFSKGFEFEIREDTVTLKF